MSNKGESTNVASGKGNAIAFGVDERNIVKAISGNGEIKIMDNPAKNSDKILGSDIVIVAAHNTVELDR